MLRVIKFRNLCDSKSEDKSEAIGIYSNTVMQSVNAGHLLQFNSGKSHRVVNNILYQENDSDPVEGQGFESVDNITYGRAGLKVNDLNSLFVNADAMDFHLKTGSKAVNAGDTDALPAYDLEGVERKGVPDIGAYAYKK